jgi:Collagen triple helix repeat (20 copies)
MRAAMQALLPDALADALGQVVADVERKAAAHLALVEARSDAGLSKLQVKVLELQRELERHMDGETARVTQAIANIRNGEPGPMGLTGLPGPQGEKGERGEDGLRGCDGMNGEDGKPGRDGVDGAPGERGPEGAPGRDGKDGVQGERGLDGEPGRDGRDGLNGLQGERGADGRNGSDGVPGRDGVDGKDGLGFDGVEQFETEREFGVTFRNGDKVKEMRWSKATLADCHRGIWKEGEYKRGDNVLREGSAWLALRDTKSMPGISDSGWLLIVKRGRDGKDGQNGKDGLPGPTGKPGRDLTQLGPDGKKW